LPELTPFLYDFEPSNSLESGMHQLANEHANSNHIPLTSTRSHSLAPHPSFLHQAATTP
jgi:hypothetical protein